MLGQRRQQRKRRAAFAWASRWRFIGCGRPRRDSGRRRKTPGHLARAAVGGSLSPMFRAARIQVGKKLPAQLMDRDSARADGVPGLPSDEESFRPRLRSLTNFGIAAVSVVG